MLKIEKYAHIYLVFAHAREFQKVCPYRNAWQTVKNSANFEKFLKKSKKMLTVKSSWNIWKGAISRFRDFATTTIWFSAHFTTLSQVVINVLELIIKEVAVIHNHIHLKEEKIQLQRNDILFVVSFEQDFGLDLPVDCGGVSVGWNRGVKSRGEIVITFGWGNHEVGFRLGQNSGEKS